MSVNPTQEQALSRLMAFPTLENLPDSFAATDIRDHIGCVITCLLDSEYYNESLDKQERTSLITFILNAQEILLSAYNGQTE